jgi:hypothetical protein
MTKNNNTNNDQSDIFGQLYSDTQSNVDAMQKGPVDVSARLKELDQESDQIGKISDEQEKSKRAKILASKFDSLREDVKTDDKDMAKAVYGIKVLIDGMDAEFQNLISFTASEQAIIDQSEDALKNAETALETSKQNVTKEKNDNGFLNLGWGKDKRVKEAEESVKNAESTLEDAKTGIDVAKQKADELKRERLMSADIGDTLNLIQVMGQKTVDIMCERTASIKSSLEAIKARKQSAFKIKNDATKRVGKLDSEVSQLESELQNEELAVDSLEVNSDEHATQVKKVSDLRADLETLRGKLKVAQAVLDEKTKSIQEHEAFELGQQKLLSNHQMWVATLKSKLQEDLVKDAAYLEMLQAASDQEIAQNVDNISSEKNARQMENVAKIIVSSDEAYIDKMKSTPEQIRRRANIEKALAQHKANLSEHENEIRQVMIDNYGIDPFQASEFTHRSDTPDTSGKDDTPSTPSGSSNNDENLFD